MGAQQDEVDNVMCAVGPVPAAEARQDTGPH